MTSREIETVFSYAIQLPEKEQEKGLGEHLKHLAANLLTLDPLAEVLDIVSEQNFNDADLVWISTVAYRVGK